MKPEVPPSPQSTGPASEGTQQTTSALFRLAHQSIRPRSLVPPIRIRFSRFANANAFIQLKHGEIEARISDILEGAPGGILEALAHILISKLYRKPVPPDHAHRYRSFLQKPAVRSALETVRQQRSRRKQIAPPAGHHYDLVAIFEEVNGRYFHGLMPRPDLGWSRRSSRQTLGHYDSSHHTIVLNRVLDNPQVPKLAVEYVMYHEMLHIKHPVEQRGNRRCVHTAAFKADERRFDGYFEAKLLLRDLSEIY